MGRSKRAPEPEPPEEAAARLEAEEKERVRKERLRQNMAKSHELNKAKLATDADFKKRQLASLPARDRDPLPPFVERNANPSRTELYQGLLAEWTARYRKEDIANGVQSGGSLTLLAEWLGVPYQWPTMWRTDQSHQPPWWVLMSMCEALDLAILLEPDRCVIVPKPRRRDRAEPHEPPPPPA